MHSFREAHQGPHLAARQLVADDEDQVFLAELALALEVRPLLVQGLRGACVSWRRRRDGKCLPRCNFALRLPYFVVLPLALMRCSIASRWLSQTASSSLAHKVAAMLKSKKSCIAYASVSATFLARRNLKMRAMCCAECLRASYLQ